jgi:hypothetical protein
VPLSLFGTKLINLTRAREAELIHVTMIGFKPWCKMACSVLHAHMRSRKGFSEVVSMLPVTEQRLNGCHPELLQDALTISRDSVSKVDPEKIKANCPIQPPAMR